MSKLRVERAVARLRLESSRLTRTERVLRKVLLLAILRVMRVEPAVTPVKRARRKLVRRAEVVREMSFFSPNFLRKRVKKREARIEAT